MSINFSKLDEISEKVNFLVQENEKLNRGLKSEIEKNKVLTQEKNNLEKEIDKAKSNIAVSSANNEEKEDVEAKIDSMIGEINACIALLNN